MTVTDRLACAGCTHEMLWQKQKAMLLSHTPELRMPPLLKTGMPADVLKSVAIYYNIGGFNIIYQSGGGFKPILIFLQNGNIPPQACAVGTGCMLWHVAAKGTRIE